MIVFDTADILHAQQAELVRRYYDNARPRAGRAKENQEAKDAYLAGIAALINVEIASNFPYVTRIEAQDAWDLKKVLDDLWEDWDTGKTPDRALVITNLIGKFRELAHPDKYEQENTRERRKLITEGGQVHLVEQEDREWLELTAAKGRELASVAEAAKNALDKVNG